MKRMKIIFVAVFVIFSVLLLFACESTDVVVSEKNASIESEDDAVVFEADDAMVETVDEDEDFAEYSRSTQEVNVPRDVFSVDKSSVLEIISNLSKVIEEYNYEEWLKYIEPSSIKYWSNKHNLTQASKRLPIKGQRLNNLHDYFRLVFVPSRKGRNVDEIRYISLDQVKAVQMRGDQDIVYYNFIKVNGKWMVKLPGLAITGK